MRGRLFARPQWSILALLAIALAARLVHLTYHSFWFDEAVSALWAAQSPGRIWQVGLGLVEDKHPPFYYLLLHGWSSVFGGGDVAQRTMGVLIGALAVLPTYAIGHRLGGRLAGDQRDRCRDNERGHNECCDMFHIFTSHGSVSFPLWSNRLQVARKNSTDLLV